MGKAAHVIRAVLTAGRPVLLVTLAAFALVAASVSVQAEQRPAPRARAEPARPSPLHLLFVGASITAGVGTSQPEDAFPELLTRRLEGRFAVSRVSVVAHRGAVVDQALDWRKPANDDLIVVHLATNDFQHGTPLAAYQDQLDQLLAQLRASSPQASLVCLGTWEAPTATNGLGLTAQQYDEVVSQACQARGGVYVSLAGLYVQPDLHGEGAKRMSAFHPNDEGAQRIAAAIYAAMQQRRMLQPGGTLQHPTLIRSS
jgi:lysophospholipase L1-like esterase